MPKCVAPVIAFVAATALIAADIHPANRDLNVHEWGTFTSIAGEDGLAMNWLPLGGATDLPCFVNRFQNFAPKVSMDGTVRMETPVIYFYSAHEITVNVGVRFPQGLITEWYPRAEVGPPKPVNDFRRGEIKWGQVKVTADAAPAFPIEESPSHYYAARQTDAAPLQIGTQQEKFLFYRGVGRFQPPVSTRIIDQGKILIKNLGEDDISNVVLFENHGGKLGFRIHGALRGETALDPTVLDGDLTSLQRELENILVTQGLYPREAEAMIETWRDSWFEEGTRVFYMVPARAIDSLLPLEIDPAPARIARVFVGRMEVITPATQKAVAEAIANNDRAGLEKYGRFLDPIAKRIAGTSSDKARIGSLLQSIHASYLTRASSCKN